MQDSGGQAPSCISGACSARLAELGMRGGRSLSFSCSSHSDRATSTSSNRSATSPTRRRTRHDKVLSVDAGKMEEIEVKASTGDVTKLKKNGNDWQIVAPSRWTPIRTPSARSLIALESLEIHEDHRRELRRRSRPFGLDPRARERHVQADGRDARCQKIDLGNKTPTGADMYARVEGQPKVFLVGASARRLAESQRRSICATRRC